MAELIIVISMIAMLWCVILISIAYTVGGDPFFFLKKRVYLLDYWGDIRFTREWKPGLAYIYPWVGVALVNLKSDGTTTGVSYIKRWSYNLRDLID